jgi:hypothetical protein
MYAGTWLKRGSLGRQCFFKNDGFEKQAKNFLVRKI